MKDRVYLENEAQIIDPLTQMHYAHLSGYGNTVFPQSHDFYELMFALSGTHQPEPDTDWQKYNGADSPKRDSFPSL